MKTTSALLATAGLVATVSGHGMLTSPAPRLPGPGLVATCGQQAANQDVYGNVQALLSTAKNQPDYNPATCKAWQCKGYTYADNAAKLQHFTVGQVVPMTFDVRAPHTGVANVSIVATATDSVIGGGPLKSYASFASNQVGVQPDELAFSITIPDVGAQCATPGACVIQHFWTAADIDQTYESCIDFVIGAGSSGGSSSSSSSAAAAASSTSNTATAAATTSLSSTTSAPAAQTSSCAAQTVTVTAPGATVTVTVTAQPQNAVSSSATTTLLTQTRAAPTTTTTSDAAEPTDDCEE